MNYKYIIKDEDGINEKIKINLKYQKYNRIKRISEEINENYEINPILLPEGNEFSKLIIYEYLNNNNLNKEEKIKLALKYQIFTNYTSLFAKVELSEKITEGMKQEIIGDEKTYRLIKRKESNESEDISDGNCGCADDDVSENGDNSDNEIGYIFPKSQNSKKEVFEPKKERIVIKRRR